MILPLVETNENAGVAAFNNEDDGEKGDAELENDERGDAILVVSAVAVTVDITT
jgi:hypothetical protein